MQFPGKASMPSWVVHPTRFDQARREILAHSLVAVIDRPVLSIAFQQTCETRCCAGRTVAFALVGGVLAAGDRWQFVGRVSGGLRHALRHHDPQFDRDDFHFEST